MSKAPLLFYLVLRKWRKKKNLLYFAELCWVLNFAGLSPPSPALIRLFDVTHALCLTCLIHMCDMTHQYLWHDSFTCVTCLTHICAWLTHMCGMTHSHVWHDSLTCVAWLISMCHMTHSHAGHDSFICVTWLIHLCSNTPSYALILDNMSDMTHSSVRHDFITRFIHMCGMTHSYVWHDSFICVTWLVHMCNMTHSHVWHDSFMCVTLAGWSAWCVCGCGCGCGCGCVGYGVCVCVCVSCAQTHVWHDSFICVTWLVHMCDMTRSYVYRDSF